MAKAKLHEHASLIDLFGPTRIANELNKLKKDRKRSLTPQAVSMWRRRGVSIWFRRAFAKMLIRNGFSVPPEFCD